MYIKQLLVSAEREIIREINFSNGLNLIIDETKNKGDMDSGNNVGKTTVLKLIYYCFGGDKKDIYTSEENHKDEYVLVKDYLLKKDVFITLLLKADLDDVSSYEIKMERNFLSKKNQ